MSKKLPDHFNDDELLTILSDSVPLRRFSSVSLGMVLKARTGLKRLVKRQKWKSFDDNSLFKLMIRLSIDSSSLYTWSSSNLFVAATNLALKALNVSPKIISKLDTHPLYPPDESFCFKFTASFLREVAHYHATVARPDGTFDLLSKLPEPVESNSKMSQTKDIIVQARTRNSDDVIENVRMSLSHCHTDDGYAQNDCRLSAAAVKESESNSFDADDSNLSEVFNDCVSPERVECLALLDRELCPSCGSRQQTYCGPCGGLRLPSARLLLPPRVPLPFDVILLLHWVESLRKCTGIHGAVLAEEGIVTYLPWSKEGSEGGDWRGVVLGLDATRDVLLFPTVDAVPAHLFPWKEGPGRLNRGTYSRDGAAGSCDESADIAMNGAAGDGDASKSNKPAIRDSTVSRLNYSSYALNLPEHRIVSSAVSSRSISEFNAVTNTTFDSGPALVSSLRRWRLVVLEGSWQHGKTMARQLAWYRAEHGLPPLPSVSLSDVVGKYWRFHEEGGSAVSTIEAIAHVAEAAGSPRHHVQALLTLFHAQRYRVLTGVREGGRAPRAIAVRGQGEGSWEGLTGTDV